MNAILICNPQGAKTIVVISYQLLTTHVSSLRRWRSLKAYLILNSLEVVFWLAVVFLTAQGMSRFCQGGYCGVSVVMVILAVIVAYVHHPSPPFLSSHMTSFTDLCFDR